MAIFSVSSHTPKHLRHFKFASVYAFNQLVANQHMVAQVRQKIILFKTIAFVAKNISSFV